MYIKSTKKYSFVCIMAKKNYFICMIMFNNYCVASVDPIPCGGEIYAPPTTFRQFSPDVIIRGGSNYTLNLSFVITEHMKLVSCQKNFPTTRGRPPKSVG